MRIENYFAIIIFQKASFIKFFFSSLILKFAIQINKKHLYIMAFDIEMIKKCMKT
jgi:hypothetical protein